MGRVTTNDLLDGVIQQVRTELMRQQAKWGVDRQDHPILWLAVLGEEVGEANKAVLEGALPDYLTELCHVAAVAIAAIADLQWARYARIHDAALRAVPEAWMRAQGEAGFGADPQ